MSDGWLAVLVVGAGTFVLKAVGPVGLAGRQLPGRLTQLLAMVAPALLAALVVAEGFASGRSLVVDARLAGVGAGGLCALLRAPFWLAVLLGATATALVRLVA